MRNTEFKANFSDWWLSYHLWNCFQMNITGPNWWYVNNGSGISLLPSGNMPLPEPMLTQVYVTLWRPQWIKFWNSWNGQFVVVVVGLRCLGAKGGQAISKLQTALMVTRLIRVVISNNPPTHNNDVIINAMASQITSLTIVFSSVYSDAEQRKHRSSASLVFVRGIHWWPVNSPHKAPVSGKMFPFDDVIMPQSHVDRKVTRATQLIWWDYKCTVIACTVTNQLYARYTDTYIQPHWLPTDSCRFIYQLIDRNVIYLEMYVPKKQVSLACIRNYILQYSVWCNYLSCPRRRIWADNPWQRTTSFF